MLSADEAAMLIAGVDTGVRVQSEDIVTSFVEVARRFIEVRGDAWRAGELDHATTLLDGFERSVEPGLTWPPALRPPVGWIEQSDLWGVYPNEVVD